MTLKIEEIVIYKIGADVSLKYGSFERKKLYSIIVEVRAQSFSGWGECGGRKFMRFLDPYTAAIKISRQLIGREITDPSSVLRKIPGKSLERDSWSWGYDGGLRAAREALSIALYDIYSKFTNTSMTTLLHSRRMCIPGMPVIHVNTASRMAEISEIWTKQFGFNHIKVKLGTDNTNTILSQIREKVGDQIDIHIDFNSAFQSPSLALQQIPALVDNFNISIVEDPYNGHTSHLPELSTQIHHRLMIDRGTFWPHIRYLTKKKYFDFINHHTDRQGGIDLALLIAATAEKAGLKSAIGSSGLVGINESAFQALSSTIGLERPCESIFFSLYSDPLFENYYGVCNDINIFRTKNHIQNGMIHLSDTPGFGFDVDIEKLKKLVINKVTIR